jgi:integrase
MKAVQKEPETIWKKVGPCLYRYAPSGVYYGLIKNAGKQIRRSLETDDLPLARRKLQEMRRDIALTDPELARRTLELQAERFLPTVSGSASTIYNVKYAIKRLQEDWPKKSPRVLAKIRKGDCEQWIATYGHLAASTINTYISCATKFFDLAVSDGAIARSPMEGITYHRRGKLTRLTPTQEQFDAIVTDLKAQPFNGHGSAESADYIALSGLLGLGQAELSGIQRQHIDLDAGTIKVFRRKTQQTFLIPVYPQAREIIERRLKSVSKEPTARLLEFDDCRSALKGACKRLKISHFEVRSLRRFFITQALRRGVDVPTVALWQGHRDGGALILKTYADEVRLDHSLRMSKLMDTTKSNTIGAASAS